MDETFPDVASMGDEELRKLIDQLRDEEREISYKRRLLHGRLDILRAELVERLKTKHEGGETLISGADVEALTEILAGKLPAAGADEGS